MSGPQLTPGPATEAPSRSWNPLALLKRLYDWTISWAESPYGSVALVLIALTEASCFPVPPDFLLIPLVLGLPRRAFFYASICSAGSVAGGIVGYWIGRTVWDQVDGFFYSYVFSEATFGLVKAKYDQYAFWAVFAAGFTPIPYKVFTIAAGVCRISFPAFVLASAVSRSLRFFLVATILWKFGEPAKAIIERYFDKLALAGVALGILGYLVIKWVL